MIDLTKHSKSIKYVLSVQNGLKHELDIQNRRSVLKDVLLLEVWLIIEETKQSEIPGEYTADQEWALKEAFEKILILTEGAAQISDKEREDLINEFSLYTDEQKLVLDLLWNDLTFYTQGKEQLSADEFILLKEKYRMLEF